MCGREDVGHLIAFNSASGMMAAAGGLGDFAHDLSKVARAGDPLGHEQIRHPTTIRHYAYGEGKKEQ